MRLNQWIRFGIFTALFALLLVSPLAGYDMNHVSAQGTTPADPTVRQVSVTGYGEIAAQPDVAVVTMGVQTEADEAGVALTQNNEQTQALLEALSSAGIADENIQTQAIRLQPRYNTEQPPEPTTGGSNAAEVMGYLATNLVEVRIDNIEEIGAVLDTAVAAGGNRIENIRFDLSDRSEILRQAREVAWNDAQQKAEQYAGLAGAELTEVLSISTFEQTPGPVAQTTFDSASAAAVPVQPGTQNVRVEVQVSWRLQ